MWFTFAIVGYAMLGVVLVMDKYILAKTIARPIVYTFYSTVFPLAFLVLLPFGVKHFLGLDLALALISGLAFGFGLFTLYVGVQKGEATHLYPFNGAVTSAVVFLGSVMFLGNKFNGREVLALALLILSGVFLSIEKTRRHTGFHSGFIFVALSGILFAISTVINKHLFDTYGFYSAFVWIQIGIGLTSLLVLPIMLKNKYFQFGRKKSQKGHEKVFVIGADKILGGLGAFFIQLAVAFGSAAVVSSLASLQYIFTFIIIFFCTKFFPKIISEYFSKGELTTEAVALLLSLAGTVLLAVK